MKKTIFDILSELNIEEGSVLDCTRQTIFSSALVKEAGANNIVLGKKTATNTIYVITKIHEDRIKSNLEVKSGWIFPEIELYPIYVDKDAHNTLEQYYMMFSTISQKSLFTLILEREFLIKPFTHRPTLLNRLSIPEILQFYKKNCFSDQNSFYPPNEYTIKGDMYFPTSIRDVVRGSGQFQVLQKYRFPYSHKLPTKEILEKEYLIYELANHKLV